MLIYQQVILKSSNLKTILQGEYDYAHKTYVTQYLE